MTVLPFVDVERLVARHMNGGNGQPRALPAPYRAVTDLPDPLEPRLPLVRLIAGTSTRDDQVTAYPRIDVHCFAATRDAMWTLTAAAHTAMGMLTQVDGQDVDQVVTIQWPYFLAWSPTVPRSVASYEIQLRPRRAVG
jgi:hypothetical protein